MARLVAAPRRSVLRQLAETGDAREDVVEIVRHAAGQSAQGLQPARARALDAQHPLRLGAAPVRAHYEVDGHAHAREQKHEPHGRQLRDFPPRREHGVEIPCHHELDAVARQAAQADEALHPVVEAAQLRVREVGETAGAFRVVRHRGGPDRADETRPVVTKHRQACIRRR